jgi:hypothetical protein
MRASSPRLSGLAAITLLGVIQVAGCALRSTTPDYYAVARQAAADATACSYEELDVEQLNDWAFRVVGCATELYYRCRWVGRLGACCYRVKTAEQATNSSSWIWERSGPICPKLE